MFKENSDQIQFEVSMTKDFLDFLISMKIEEVNSADEVELVLEEMLNKPYIKSPLRDQLEVFLRVTNSMHDKGLTTTESMITFMSSFYLEQTSGEMYDKQ